MTWNPHTYNQFKAERYAPFDDLVKLINIQPAMQVIDLGCGTGELTCKLADDCSPAGAGLKVTGIDASAAMLEEAAAFKNEIVSFEQRSIEETVKWVNKYDLVFSHAALQWLDHHEALLPQIIGMLKPGGQIAIQLPSNHDHYTHTLLNDMAAEESYQQALGGWTRNVSTLSIEVYAQILFDNGCTEITVFEKAYPHVLQNAEALYNWMQGTALIRYLERLPEDLQKIFAADYKNRLAEKYIGSPIFYPFKRILMAATVSV